MRAAATWLTTISLIGSMVPNGEAADRLATRIPVEFQGRWLSKPDQCQSGYEGWLYVSDLQVQQAQGIGYVVSVRRIATLEIEIDVTWRAAPKGRDDGRTVLRFALLQDGRKLVETRDGTAESRVRCAGSV